MLHTVGFHYYIDYILPVSVTEDPGSLKDEDAVNYYKIIYIKSGTCHFILNQREFILSGAYALCLNEQDEITFLELQKDVVRIVYFKPYVINILFQMESLHNNNSLTVTDSQDLYFIKQFLHGTDLKLKLLPLRTMVAFILEQKMKQMNELLTTQDNNGWPCRSRSYLFEVLFILVRQEDEMEKEQEAGYGVQSIDGCSKLSADVIYYLQSCYNHKITIDKLSDEFHTNRTTLQFDFKKHTGKSINQYLNQLRLNMASAMLRETELSIDEICERTGFSDISYFSRVFKKGLKCTPAKYRKLYNRM